MLPFILRHDAPAEMAYASDCANRAAVVNGVVSAFLLTFAALFPIVNPIEGAPFFLAMTAHVSSAERRVLARNVAINGFALLLGSMVIGPYLLEVFGLQLPVVRIAGGLVVAALGWSCSPRSSGRTTATPPIRGPRATSAASIR